MADAGAELEAMVSLFSAVPAFCSLDSSRVLANAFSEGGTESVCHPLTSRTVCTYLNPTEDTERHYFLPVDHGGSAATYNIRRDARRGSRT